MNSVEAILNLTTFPIKKPYFSHTRKSPNRKKFKLVLCNSNGGGGSSKPEGDQRKQELLAKMAMLQAQKARLTDFLDERSSYLTQFVEDSNAEFDEIAENALRELDEAGDKILENLEERMQEFEETAESYRREIEMNKKALTDFEDQIEKARNEGLFFKNLKQISPQQKANAKEEIKKLGDLTRENAGSVIRRNFYLALICLLSFAIIDALISSPVLDWPRIGVLGVILLGLIAQFVYEQKFSLSGSAKTEQEKEK